jgi:hypothetical protein
MSYAEDRPYWDTTVSPAKSLGEVQELLEDFGAGSMIITQGQAQGKYAWVIRFQWQDRTYRFVFTPLACRWPDRVTSFGGKKQRHDEHARAQMGRIAVWFTKAILTAAEAQPAALFGYLELPGVSFAGAIPPVASEVPVDNLTALLPLIELPAQLKSGEEEKEEDDKHPV